MSSCKHWKERRRSDSCRSEVPSRMSPLLRLDSTGEISSAGVTKSLQEGNSNCNDQCSNTNSVNHFMFKDFINGFNMTSVLESANACLGTASSYLEGFCNSRSKRNLVRSESDTTSLRYLHNMWRKPQPVKAIGKDQTVSLDSVLPLKKGESVLDTKSHLISTTNCIQSSCPIPTTTTTMSNSILGIFQSTYSTVKSKPKPYIPPPIKRRADENECKNRPVIDRKLTPYNARLLERGKQQRENPEYSNKKQFHMGNMADNRVTKNSVKSFVCKNRTFADVEFKDETVLNSQTTCDNTQNENISELGADPSDIVNDWFEYENENTGDKFNGYYSSESLQTMSSKTKALSCEDDKSCYSSSLNNWHSEELDREVHKTVASCLHSSQKEDSYKSLNEPLSVAVNPQDSGKMLESAKFDNEKPSKTAKETADKKLESYCKSPSILYVRNFHNGRKCRPSSKKRRRQKYQPSNLHNGPENEQNSSAKTSSGSVAFILGINQNSKQNASHSFHISCDTDSSSDWSDSDLETDGADDGESVANLCAFNNPFSLFNLDVMCSIQPTSPTHGSTLDAINLSWQVNVSVDPSYKSTKKEKTACKKAYGGTLDFMEGHHMLGAGGPHSPGLRDTSRWPSGTPAKKVQFVEDGSLATVHRMVAWSYAYAAARRGPWEEMARDRGRFMRRITDGNKLLAPILDPVHRRRIQRERFTTGED